METDGASIYVACEAVVSNSVYLIDAADDQILPYISGIPPMASQPLSPE
jgi:hypothetical protein